MQSEVSKLSDSIKALNDDVKRIQERENDVIEQEKRKQEDIINDLKTSKKDLTKDVEQKQL